ncbi:MAG: proteinase inhibitor [Myxococcota bacterium]
MPRRLPFAFSIAACLALACSSEAPIDAQLDPPDAEEPEDAEEPDAMAVPRCEYRNAFTGESECKAYVGEAWTSDAARTDCERDIPGGGGTYIEDEGRCAVDPLLGRCDSPSAEALETYILLGGDDPGLCTNAELACTTFAMGEFTPGPPCEEATEDDDHVVFIWPYETCSPPVDGEPPGERDGEVCVWESINGCVEEGRDFRDYGSCEVVLTNRPYYPVPGAETAGPEDPRMDDSAYREELAWVTTQVEASACICCHSEQSPQGPAIWSVDGPTLWPDMMSDQAIGMFAGYVDSSALGAYPPEDNNGFDRIHSGMPSTDPMRMVEFWLGEFERRGLTPEDMEDVPPIGAALQEQVDYELPPCEAGDGIDADGVVTWEDPRRARYLYVLEEGSRNPGIPPNFDMPEGTVWRIDVPHTGQGFQSGLTYGSTPGDSWQRLPADDAPPPLVSGRRYHLYALYDVAIPIARCVFEAP